MNGSRPNRVGIEIKKVLSEYLLSGAIDEYDIVKPAMISMTDIVMSPDLTHAKIFISSMDNNVSNEKCLEFLENHVSKLRYYLGRTMKLKFVPELRFIIDNSFEYGKKIDSLLNSLHIEKNS